MDTQLQNSLPILLLQARDAVMREFMPLLREHDLSPQQWRVIRVLVDSEPLDSQQLAERSVLLAPSLSRIIANLHERGLINRKVAANDQRRQLLSITSKGRKLFEKLAPYSAQRYERISRLYGPKKLDQLYQLLQELIETLDAAPPE